MNIKQTTNTIRKTLAYRPRVTSAPDIRTYSSSSSKLKLKLNEIALHDNLTSHLRATRCHLPYGITQCYLPPDTSELALPNLK